MPVILREDGPYTHDRLQGVHWLRPTLDKC